MIYSPTKPGISTLIDWSDPLSQGLVGCVLFQENICDLVANRLGTRSGTVTYVPQGINVTTDTSYASINHVSSKLKTGDATIIARITPTLIGTGTFYTVQMGDVPSTNDIMIAHSGNIVIASAGLASGNTVSLTVHATAYAVGVPVTIAVTLNSTTFLNGYINGKFANRIAFPGRGTTYSQEVTLGNRSTKISGARDIIHFALFYNRALSADEIIRLHEITKGW